ncbi:MAG: DUF1152 domain-containing protein [Thermoleophilaceae bacterium]
MSDADALLSASRRPLVLGIGGGGDVVGALATAEACRAHGARPVVGGVTWERRPIDPEPGPRPEAEIEGAHRLAPGVLAASGSTRVRESGVLFAESRMAELLGEETVLVDATLGPAAIADGLATAAGALEADLIVFVDVGGDALAHGAEPGLASPLCDSLLLAAAAHLAKRAVCVHGEEPAAPGDGAIPVLGGIFGIGCDGELTPAEVLERLAEVAAAGGFAGARGLTPPIAARLAEAVDAVPTEASAQALRCFHGAIGETTIRQGRRTVELSPAGALTFYFDVAKAIWSAARLAAAVIDARDLDHANKLLNELGVRTELDYERDALHTVRPPSN